MAEGLTLGAENWKLFEDFDKKKRYLYLFRR